MHPGWDEFLEKVKLQLAETFLQEKDAKKQKEKYIQIDIIYYIWKYPVQIDKPLTSDHGNKNLWIQHIPKR